MRSNAVKSLEDQVHELRRRVSLLEAALQPGEAALLQEPLHEPAAAIPQPAPPPLPTTEEQQPLVPPPFSAPPNHTAPSGERSLENRIGSQWFNRIGILAVLTGMALFLKLAIDNHWIGPLGRVLIGLVAGVAFIAWSERFRRQGYTAFSFSLKAVGSGILYLSLWSAFSLFHLLPAGVAFAAMVLVTAFNGFMAWTEDAELLAVYSIAGGLGTPLLVSTGGNHEVSLFSYLLLLNLATLCLVILRPWSRLLFGTFTGTLLFFTGWWFGFYSRAQFGRTAFFATCFFLLFAFAPRLVCRKNPAPQPSSWDHLATMLLPVANAAFGFLTFHSLFASAHIDWAAPWIAVTLAAFFLLLLRLPARGILRAGPDHLPDLHLTLAVVLLALAIPLKAHGRWLTIGWLLEGAALLWIAARTRSQLLQILAQLCLALGLVALLTIHPPAAITPLRNQRFATFCVAIAVFAFAARLARLSSSHEDRDPALAWPVLAVGAALLVNLLTLLALSLEIHNYWWFAHWAGQAQRLQEYKIYAQFSYSALFMAFGALLLAVGVWRRSAFVRWQALVLVAVAIGKVFLVDVRELSQGYSVLSFLGLGALLLGVSFIYQRDWLHLRHLDEPTL